MTGIGLGLMILLGGLIILFFVVMYAISAYNRLVSLRNRYKNAYAQIDVQLKRRYDLIPNLVNTVKGYAAHEKGVFEDVTKARTAALGAQGVAETAKAENQFQQTLKSLFAVAENYPQLKASDNFLDLQAQLTDTEDKVMASRRFYNGVVRDFNTKRKVFPTSVFANMLGFTKDREFFELDEAAYATAGQPVEVKF